MVGSSRRPFHLHAVHAIWATTCNSQTSRCDSRCQLRCFPTLFVCVLFAQTQNDWLRSTIFHTSSLWCWALVLERLPADAALSALHTTIPVLYQHRDFRALLVDADWREHCQGPTASPPSTLSLLSRSPRKSPPWRGGNPRECVLLSHSIRLVGECLEEEADRHRHVWNVGHVANPPPHPHVPVAELLKSCSVPSTLTSM